MGTANRTAGSVAPPGVPPMVSAPSWPTCTAVGLEPPIHVEIQPTGWLLDGGLPLWVAMAGAILLAVRTAYLVALRSDGTLQDAATAIVCLQLTVLCLCLTGPVFNTQLGIQFWAVSGAVLGPPLASAGEPEAVDG